VQQDWPNHGRLQRRGVTAVETLVGFTLLTAALSVATPLVVRNGRLLSEQQDYRLALDEVSNQLERLSALRPDELAAALDELVLSSATASRLPTARLSGQLEAEDDGQRLTVSLSWEEAQRYRAPISLTTWIYPRPRNTGEAREGGDS
jgi:hypothetical protein